jgi:hypothetical protein
MDYRKKFMLTDWSRFEVEVTVADYFDMLDKEIRGIEYNKTSHRKQLSSKLNDRSDGAIERKHQNISAVLILLGFPYISGYKPLGNFQHLLYEIVSDRLRANIKLEEIVQNQVVQPAEIPSIGNILASMVEPPVSAVLKPQSPGLVRDKAISGYHTDYLAREAANVSLGNSGELFVIAYEKANLLKQGKMNLADRIEHVSVTHGDSAGFDILSFDESGREKYIEVKTTAYGPLTPFYVTANEVTTSRKTASDYFLYRTFEFRRKPKIFNKRGSLEKSFTLDPSQYVAKIF